MARIEDGKVYFGEGEAEHSYSMVKRGRAQAEQLVGISSWLSRYGSLVFDTMGDRQMSEISNIEAISRFLGVLSVPAMMDAFITVTGCTPLEADSDFDIGVLADAISELFSKNESFKRVVNRFFSGSTSS